MLAPSPSSLGEGEREPGNHCVRMRQSYQQNLVSIDNELRTPGTHPTNPITIMHSMRKLKGASSAETRLQAFPFMPSIQKQVYTCLRVCPRTCVLLLWLKMFVRSHTGMHYNII